LDKNEKKKLVNAEKKTAYAYMQDFNAYSRPFLFACPIFINIFEYFATYLSDSEKSTYSI